MIVTDSDRIIARIVAAWTPLEQSQRAIWREHLQPLEYKIALDATKLLEQSNPRRPALAEFRAAYRMEADRHRPLALNPAYDHAPDSNKRFDEIVAWLKLPREPITEKTLDEAGIPRWRERLSSAVRDDRDRGTGSRSYDETWAQIRRELGREDLVFPDGSIYGAS